MQMEPRKRVFAIANHQLTRSGKNSQKTPGFKQLTWDMSKAAQQLIVIPKSADCDSAIIQLAADVNKRSMGMFC